MSSVYQHVLPCFSPPRTNIREEKIVFHGGLNKWDKWNYQLCRFRWVEFTILFKELPYHWLGRRVIAYEYFNLSRNKKTARGNSDYSSFQSWLWKMINVDLHHLNFPIEVRVHSHHFQFLKKHTRWSEEHALFTQRSENSNPRPWNSKRSQQYILRRVYQRYMKYDHV